MNKINQKIFNKINKLIKLYYIFYIIFGIFFISFNININFKNIFVLGLSCDGIFNGINFMNYYIKKDLSESQILNNIIEIYDIDIITRYEYYFILNLFFYIIRLMLLNSLNISFYFFNKILTIDDIIYCIFYPIVLPIFINYFNKINLGQRFFNYIKIKRYIFFKKFFSKQISKFIEKNTIITGEPAISIEYQHIMPLWDNIDNFENIFWSFIKNILLISAINYLKQNYSNISYNIIKKFYTLKTGVKLSTITLHDAQKNIRNIIINNKWNTIMQTQNINSLRIIYSNYDNVNNYFIHMIKFKLLVFFSYWSIGYYFHFCLIPITNSIIEYYRGRNKLNVNYYKIINFIFSFISSFFIDNIIIISFITAYGYPLLFNKLTFCLFKYILKNKNIIIMIHTLKYNIFIESLFTLYFIINYLFNTKYLFLISTITILFILNNYLHKSILIILLICNVLNNFNLPNIILNIYIIHIFYNILFFYKNIVEEHYIEKKINNSNNSNDSNNINVKQHTVIDNNFEYKITNIIDSYYPINNIYDNKKNANKQISNLEKSILVLN